MQFDPDAPLRGAIVAMNPDRVIGSNGGIPWHYSEDLKRFKSRTMGSTMIMGRLTWESLGRRSLPGRKSIVISRGAVADVEHYDDIGKAFDACAQDDTWIIGGGQIYAASMNWITLLDVTYVPDVVTDADAVKFPDIDWTCWREASRNPLDDSTLVNVIYHKI